MGILDNLERGLERVVNGAFAKTFRSGLQPVEITAALRRELDTKAAVLSRDRIIAPNRFVVLLSPSDFEQMSSMGDTLIDELTRLVAKHAATQHYQFAGGITSALNQDPARAVGVVQVTSENVSGSVTWVAVLEIAGKRYSINKSRTIIGRGTEADITVDDSGISRKHVEILWDGTRAQANDLGSTNGSKLNGHKLVSSALEADSIITIGQTSITLRLLPQAAGEETTSPAPAPAPGGFWGPRE